MIQTDVFYAQPIVCKLITGHRDRYIQLDQASNMELDRVGYIAGTYLKPVSYVSDKAASYQ